MPRDAATALLATMVCEAVGRLLSGGAGHIEDRALAALVDAYEEWRDAVAAYAGWERKR